jgi:aminoglycoside phosphotransferase (APT) family kinase protein
MSSDRTVEGARPVRDEDAFDVEAVARWLRDNAEPPLREGLTGVPEVQQFSGGASNLTYLLRYPASDEDKGGNGAGRDLILRRAPRGTKAKGAHDMGREFRIQRQLKPVFPYVPGMVGFCDDSDVAGSDFYVMERLDGVVPRADLSPDALTAEQARRLCLNMLDVLVELHSVDPEAAGLGSLGKGLGYVRRQVDGWSARWRNAVTDDAPDFGAIMEWLDANQPDDVANCVIHNDFKLDNLVFDRDDPTKVVGVLDWEMATLGDPLMDLGGDLAFWVQADDDEEFQLFRRVPTHLPGMITRAEFVETYCDRMGFTMTPEHWRFYEVFGLFRLAVISQQIYYRYFHKQTTNEMFALFGPAAHLAGKRIVRLLQ